MKLTRLPSLLPGERPVAVEPAFAPALDANWQRRLNLYAGRTLTAGALESEQTHRAARLALAGQALSAGVVYGLECLLEQESQTVGDATQVVHFLHIAPGLGLSAQGEAVALDAAQRIEVLNTPVYAPVAILDGAETTPTGSLVARRLGPPLRELMVPEIDLPHAGILVLQPVYNEEIAELDPNDPCERDPKNEAFEDQRKIDAARLVYYAWPEDWQPLPVFDDQWRNRLAYSIFTAELSLGRDDTLPWEDVGLPIALIGFDANWQPLFTDRAAVVRAGGKPKRRSNAFPSNGNLFLWQARMQQVAEHAAEFIESELAKPNTDGQSDAERRQQIVAALPRQFRYLPPAGLLPKEVAEPRAHKQTFFPASFAVDAVPIPEEQLDIAFEASAALAPYDTFDSDAVRLLAPVPQNWYEPRLLQTEEVAGEFFTRLNEFITDRGIWLQRRADVRAKTSALNLAIRANPLDYPSPDPDALEEESVGTAPLNPAEDVYGTTVDAAGLKATEFETLKERLRTGTPINGLTRESLATEPSFPASLPVALRAKISYDKDAKMLAFTGVMSADERAALLKVSTDNTYQVATNRLFARAQNDELSQLDALGVEGFIDLLEEKIAHADDQVDVGFLRVQADLYRVRQLVLGNTAASRLTVSPALAGIAKSKSAVASQQQINEFYQTLKGRKLPGQGPAGGPAPPAGGPTIPPAAARIAPASFSLAAAGDSLISVGGISATGLFAGDIRLAKQSTATDAILKASGAQLLEPPVKTGASREEVLGQSAVVGKALLRTSTIAERMEAPQAPEAKNSATATKHDVVKSLAELPISVDGLFVVGVATGELDQKSGLPKRGEPQPLQDFARTDALGKLLNEPDPRTDDESQFFVSGVELADHSIALLRNVEGRIAQYRNALELCRATLAKLTAAANAAALRLTVIDRELDEARHDVGVARALLAEETTRIARINERRDQIVREHVKFLAYHRPRSTDALRSAPVRPLAAGLFESPLPACLQNHGNGPHELRALIETLREAPVNWFPALRVKLIRLDRPSVLLETLQSAKLRAERFVPLALDNFPARGGSLTGAVTNLVAVQQNVIAQKRINITQLDLSVIASASWQIARDRAAEVVSLGDLIDSPNRRSDLARDVAEEMERITGVAACLHARFAAVLPIVRLTWAERMSQFDGPVNLRNLSALPRFHEIDPLDQRELQSLADWMYGRIDPLQSEAVDLVNDLVRLTILLASHAPVNEIVSGRVHQPATVRPGHRVELTAIDPAKVRIGMQVMMYDRNQVVARAVVEDISATQVAARVVEADSNGVELKVDTRVQFTEARSLGFALRPLS